MNEIFLVVTSSVGGHLELSSIGEIDLDLFCFPLLMKISRGNEWDRRPNRQCALLALGVSQAFRQGFEVCAHSKLLERSLQ